MPTRGQSPFFSGPVLTICAQLNASAGGVQTHRASQVFWNPVVVGSGAGVDPPAFSRRSRRSLRSWAVWCGGVVMGCGGRVPNVVGRESGRGHGTAARLPRILDGEEKRSTRHRNAPPRRGGTAGAADAPAHAPAPVYGHSPAPPGLSIVQHPAGLPTESAARKRKTQTTRPRDSLSRHDADN